MGHGHNGLIAGDLEDLASVMNAIESKGLIQRDWRSNQGAYSVTV